MKKILRESFFNRDTLIVSQALLGKYLVRRIGKREYSGTITEVEAYDGFHDKASHASKGKTKRNEVMFGNPGHWYVYLVYGFHWMLNIVTREKDYPAAILIRGIEDIRGPGKVTQTFKVDKSLNALKADTKSGLWIEDRGVKVKRSEIKRSPRVGVSYAGPLWSKKHYRYLWIPNKGIER